MKKISKYYKTAQAFDEYYERSKKHVETPELVLFEKGYIDAELRPLLQAALWLEHYKTSSNPRPGFVGSSWKRLSRKIKSPEKDVTTSKGLMQIRYAFRSALAVCLALVLLLNSSVIASASKSSAPGQIFYKVKKAEESVQLALRHSAEDSARLHIHMVKRRAAEVEELLLDGRYKHIGSVVAEYRYHLNKAWTAIDYWRVNDYQGANTISEEFRLFLNNQVLVWQTLAVMAPYPERQYIDNAIEVSLR
jgi:hypothetical protein